MRQSMLAALLLTGCVPNGPATTDAGSVAAAPAAPKPRPMPSQTTPVAASSAAAARGAVDTVASPALARTPSPALGTGFDDNFERSAVGPDWRVTPGGDWRID